MKIIKVGRGKDNDEILNDSTVSRNHLQIFFGDDGLVVVTDLDSANGTTVNGKKIYKPTKLEPLDILKAGNSLIKWKNHLKDDKIRFDNDEEEIIYRDPRIFVDPVPNDLPPSSEEDNVKLQIDKTENRKKSNLYLSSFKNQLITVSIISLIIILVIVFKDKIEKVQDSISIFDKVETLYTSHLEPLISNISFQRKQRTDVTYDFTCMNNNPDNEIINGLGDFKRTTDEIFLSDIKVSLNDEVKMGNDILKSYQSQYTVFSRGEIVNYLKNILNDLTSRIAKPRGFNYQIYYVKGKPDNVVTSGGKIFVFEKFYNRFKNSSEVAAVLAHEIAHNEIGHLTSYVKKQKAADDFGVFGEIFLELERAFTPPSFNQKQEVQADLFGIDLVQASSYDSCSSLDFWTRLAKNERQYDSFDNLLSSHPYSNNRTRCIKNHLKSNYNYTCNR